MQVDLVAQGMVVEPLHEGSGYAEILAITRGRNAPEGEEGHAAPIGACQLLERGEGERVYRRLEYVNLDRAASLLQREREPLVRPRYFTFEIAFARPHGGVAWRAS